MPVVCLLKFDHQPDIVFEVVLDSVSHCRGLSDVEGYHRIAIGTDKDVDAGFV